jgi:hypothetical protein
MRSAAEAGAESASAATAAKTSLFIVSPFPSCLAWGLDDNVVAHAIRNDDDEGIMAAAAATRRKPQQLLPF